MPFESEAQRKAMYAAASGHSNIGIPEKVAKKFIKHSEDGDIPEEPTPLSTPELKEDSEIDPHNVLIEAILAELGKETVAGRPDDTKHKLRDMKHILADIYKNVEELKSDSEAWETKEGKNKNGGLNEKGRESYNKEHGAHLKAPQPEGGARKKSFCARMKGMKAKLTSEKTAHDPDSRINKSLRKWKCDSDSIKADLEKICDAMIDYAESIPDSDPCWSGYHQLGMKEKDGKEVPNCIPDAANSPHLIPEQPTHVEPIDKMAGAKGRASGIMFVTPEGETLLIRRGSGGGDYPNTWCIPGGHQNSNGETLEDAARRECFEETGLKYDGKLDVLYDDGQFCYYIARDVKKESVTLNYESSGYDWCNPANPPLPLHPGLETALRVAMAKTEYDQAELIREGILASPQMFANVMLLAIRITGTGLAYRSSIEENVWRDPSLYLNENFLKRCNGLIVIMDHPETAVLNSKEFKDRAVGSIILPYIKGDEVWGIAKIYDQDAINEICEGEISTSPSVVFDNTAGNTTLTTENGEPLLIEGVPFLLDHIAIVTKARGSKGVWDKGGEPAGVLLTNPEVSDMTENRVEPKADAQGDKLDSILSMVSGLVARMDDMEKNLPAAPLVTAADKKRKDDDDCKMDDDEDEESEAEAKKFMERKMDSKKRRMDDDEDDMKHRKDAKKRKDAEGSNPKEHEEGEIKPDDEGEMEGQAGEMNFKKDDDDEEEEARKADEEAAMYSDAQAKADSVFSSFGKSASRPLAGESLMNYRKRLLRGLQAYSDAYKDVNINSIKDAKLLALAEKQIFADAIAASRASMNIGAGQLVAINEKDRAGRTITKFRGDMETWLGQFKVPAQRVTKFHTMNNQR